MAKGLHQSAFPNYITFVVLKSTGVSHGDDTGYVLQTSYMNPTTTPEDIEMMEVMSKMWSNFARDGYVTNYLMTNIE